MLEVWIRKFVIAMLVGIGVALMAASLTPPLKGGYKIDPLLAGGGAALAALGQQMARRRVKSKKKARRSEDEDLGLGVT